MATAFSPDLGTEQRNEKGEEIEMNWFRTSFQQIPSEVSRA